MTPTKCARCNGSGWITIRKNPVPCVCFKGQQNATIPAFTRQKEGRR